MNKDLETAAQEVAARDTTFDNVIPERLWVLTRTSPDKKYIKIYIEINGIEKEVDSIYVGSYDGIISNAHNLTWILSSAHMQKRIEELEAERDKYFDGSLYREVQTLRQISKLLEEGLTQAYCAMADCASRVKAPDQYMFQDIKETLAEVQKLRGNKA